MNTITFHPSNFKFSPVHMELSSGKTVIKIKFHSLSQAAEGAGQREMGDLQGGKNGQLTGLPGQETSGVTDPGPPPPPVLLPDSSSPHSRDRNG